MTVEKKDYYETLGVPRNADAEAIRSAYRKLALKYHPDRNKDDKTAEEKFKQVGEAYEVLSNPDKRRQYDRFGHADVSGNAGASSFEEAFRGFDFGGLGGFEDLFGGLFGGGARPGFGGGRTAGFRGPARGADVRVQLSITLLDAFRGAEKSFTVQGANGGKPVRIRIPAGVHEGTELRAAGKGQAGTAGTAGDLYIQIGILADPRFLRVNDDLKTTVSVPLSTAVLGGDVSVPTLTDNVRIKIPEGTQPGTTMRVRGQGMPILNHATNKGDLLVTIQVRLPRNLTPEQKKAFQQLPEE